MKFFITPLIILCFLFIDCTNKKVEDPMQLVDDSTILRMNDSINHLTVNFQKNKDTTLLQTALKLSDTVLKLDQTEEGQYYGTLRKSQILTLLGRKKEAFLLQDKITDRNPESIERLIYNGVASKLRYQADSSEIFFSKALELCKKQLAEYPENVELIISIATIYIYQGKKDAAIKEIDDALKMYPTNEQLNSFRQGINKSYENAQEFLKGKV